MARRSSRMAFCVALISLAVRPAVAFQSYGSGSTFGSRLSSMESTVTNQLHGVEKTLESAHKELANARKQLAQTESEHQKLAREYNSLHQQVQKEAESNPALVQARKEFADAERAFHDERARIVKQLKARADYQKTLETKQTAASQLKALNDTDPQEARSLLAKQILELSSTLSIQETKAIEVDRQAKKAQQTLHEAEQDMAGLIRDRNNSIDKDSRLNSEKTALNRARSDHDAAKRQFAHAQSASSQAERAYQSLMQEKIALDQQRNQQHRANRYGSYGRGGYGRRHYGVGPLGGALRIIPSPTIIVH